MKKKITMQIVTIVTNLVLLTITVSSMAQEPARPAAAPAERPAFRMPARIVSPEILPDSRVTFRVYAKDAQKITVSGEWQAGPGGAEELVKNDTGLFVLTAGSLKPELYAYTFTVDGVRTIDQNNVQVRRDGANYQSFFIIPGPESDLYIQKNNVPHGTVNKIWYNSSVLGFARRVYVYTPAG
ncbi:MAG TPA: hypothetical protein VLR52_01695, partial [Bacteroidales bacterium]|nr:hypothetical protein [Bacteroidales bacterium]